MTFEEAIDKIILHQEEEDRNPGAYVSYDGLGAMVDILRELEETYAPKIKMTLEQRDELMRFLSEDEEFEDFCYGYRRKLYKEFSEEEELYKEFTESELMRAWLHPELIEVSDDR